MGMRWRTRATPIRTPPLDERCTCALVRVLHLWMGGRRGWRDQACTFEIVCRGVAAAPPASWASGRAACGLPHAGGHGGTSARAINVRGVSFSEDVTVLSGAPPEDAYLRIVGVYSMPLAQ